jgi:K+ transporter
VPQTKAEDEHNVSCSEPESSLDIEHERPSIDAKPITAAAILMALGIVYGDLGTSPLYVFPAIAKSAGGSLDETTAMGSMSLIFWALVVIISVKYCLVVMRADNHAEGGILALMSMARVSWRGRKRVYLMLGLLGAALLYGDGVITPSISVLSAVEGLTVATSRLRFCLRSLSCNGSAPRLWAEPSGLSCCSGS